MWILAAMAAVFVSWLILPESRKDALYIGGGILCLIGLGVCLLTMPALYAWLIIAHPFR